MSGELASTIRPHSPPHGNRAEEKSAQRHAYLFVPSRQLIPALLTQRHIFGQITLHTAKITTTSIGMQKKGTCGERLVHLRQLSQSSFSTTCSLHRI